MRSNVHFKVASDAHDFRGILDLQRKNLLGSVAPACQDLEGFVFVQHGMPLLMKMADRLPQIVAINDGRVVGYSLAMTTDMRRDIPALEPMFRRIKMARFRGRPLTDLSFWIGGQVCVDRAFRGRGLMKTLYLETQARVPQDFRICVTEVASRNSVSLKAHTKMGFEVVDTYEDATEEWKLIAWDHGGSAR